MKSGTPLKAGDTVKIRENYPMHIFAGSLLIVEEPKVFGCQGFVLGEQGQQYPLRLDWDDMELVQQDEQ